MLGKCIQGWGGTTNLKTIICIMVENSQLASYGPVQCDPAWREHGGGGGGSVR